MYTQKTNIIEQAYNNLVNALDVNFDKGNVIKWNKPTNRNWDALFNLKNRNIYVIARNEIRPNQVGQIFRLKEQKKNLLVAANYITPTARQLLKEKGINYVDRAGNIFFKVQPFHVFVEGIPNRPPAQERKNKAFTNAGLKVIFQILLDPGLVNATYREIAGKAGVALGAITKIMRGLKEGGYLLKKTQKEWILNDYKKLLDRWQMEYTERLKPTLFVKRFRPADKNFHTTWKQLTFEKTQDTVWGGEPAADILTNYLKPQKFIVYTNALQNDLIKTYHWVPDDQGTIAVYRKFWPYTPDDETGIVAPPPLIYADLIETGDARCVETAQMIYERYLKKHERYTSAV
jgi:hypothetical protein